MIARRFVIAAALSISACSKSEPASSSTTSAPASPELANTAPASGAAGQGRAPAAPTPSDDTHMMPSGTRMQGHPRDGGTHDDGHMR